MSNNSPKMEPSPSRLSRLRRMDSVTSEMEGMGSPKKLVATSSQEMARGGDRRSAGSSGSEKESRPSTPTVMIPSAAPAASAPASPAPASPATSAPVPPPLSTASSLTGGSIDIKADFIEEDRPLLPGIMIRNATLEKLAEATLDSFNLSGEVVESSEYPRVLFLMHKWFVDSDTLANTFMKLYTDGSYHPKCHIVDCMHGGECTHCLIQQYKTKVCICMRFWITYFPMHFDLNQTLKVVVQKFQSVIQEEGESQHRELVDVSKVPSYDWMRNMSVRSPQSRHSTNSRTSLVLNNLTPLQLAEQLTFLEYKAFRRLTFEDFKNYAVTASLMDNPKLERSIALFNGLSQWVQCMVLCKTTPQQRADVIVKFVNVAKRLRQIQNFNTLMAVVGGLSHSALARLNKTNACIPQETQKVLADFADLLSSNNNFSNYRKALHSTHGFKIPILGVHLKDLILLHTALPDRVEETLINFRKMAQLSITFTELMQVQVTDIPIEANMDLVNTIKLSLDMHYTEDEIYELSLAREPRNSLSSPSTPTKPVVFAEWVAGVSPPDTETINKHVHDMVEAVFKNYDHDRDGFISHAEFEEIAGNFPFIASFCVLDADKDGMISKAEMKTYFIRANCHALRNSFKHDFHENTYFKPTFCIHCTGLLWGLIKQGWKCKECSINAHKHCKDLVVMECRPKSHAAVHSRSTSLTNGGSKEVTMATKRKMSQRQKRTHSTRATQTDEQGVNSILPSSPRISLREEDESVTSSISAPGTRVNSRSNSLQHVPPLSAPGSRSNSLHHPLPSTMSAPATRSNSLNYTPPTSTPTRSPASSRSNSLFTRTTSVDSEVIPETSLLAEKLQKAEEVGAPGSPPCDQNETREKLLVENQLLQTRVDSQSEQIAVLKTHIGLIRQHTITFILDQMDTLHMQRDTEV